MDKPFRFAIPESMSSVLDWFTEALELEVRRFGNSGVEFSVEGPRPRTLHGSDGNTTVMEIVILGFRTLGKPIPSDWAPETWIVEMEGVWEPLGSVMAFQFAALGGSTRVWATFEEQHPGVQVLFEEFLKRIDTNYPMGESLSRRYRTQRDLQLMERIDRHLTAESYDTDAGVGAAIGAAGRGADRGRRRRGGDRGAVAGDVPPQGASPEDGASCRDGAGSWCDGEPSRAAAIERRAAHECAGGAVDGRCGESTSLGDGRDRADSRDACTRQTSRWRAQVARKSDDEGAGGKDT